MASIPNAHYNPTTAQDSTVLIACLPEREMKLNVRTETLQGRPLSKKEVSCQYRACPNAVDAHLRRTTLSPRGFARSRSFGFKSRCRSKLECWRQEGGTLRDHRGE